jgi:phosphoribosylaminoimidazolecarboxamide formyltransferase / IMP cyclohydrolase
MIRDAKGEIMENIPVKNVLISVFDKSGLEEFVEELAITCPGVNFISTGGTYKKLKEAQTPNLIEASEFTEFPEMDGGLVKTLHPKIHGGILGERTNPKHQEYLANLSKTIQFLDSDVKRLFDAKVGEEYKVKVVEGIKGVYIDMAVVNLYPFQQVISQPDTTFEKARGNIDIGGPTMLRAAAKNFLSCASVCDPKDYELILKQLRENEGSTTFDQRAALAPKVFKMTFEYDKAIYDWSIKQSREDARKPYTFSQR